MPLNNQNGGSKWSEAMDAEIRRLSAEGLSYSKIAGKINATFGTVFTRSAVIGRANRIGFKPGRVFTRMTPEEKRRRATERKRKLRWAAKPDLAERYRKLAENRKQFLEAGATLTSSAYRRHVPRLPDMTKTELRAMLATAMQNTAEMEVG